jgi:DNA modification methylase
MERLMGGERADCVFTSFPYAVGIDYGETYEDTIENLRGLILSLSTLFLDIVVDGGFAILNFGDIVSGRRVEESEEPNEYPMALEYYPVFHNAGWYLWTRRIWCKPVAKVAAPWCASSNRSATNWEHIWTWKKAGKVIIGRIGKPMDSQTGWIDTSKLEGVDVGKGTHGAGMPISIAEWMINVHSRDNSIIHEPFCGTGTTIIAAQNLSRRCYAMEISPAYCAVILERFHTAFPDIEITKI